MEVLSTPAVTAVWMCPECGHGSSEPRDERAHLDAHRQLRAFFREWEAGTVAAPPAGGVRSRRRMAVVAVVVLLVLVASMTVFSRINRAPDGFRTTIPPATGASGDAARPQPEAVVPPSTVVGADRSPAGSTPAARPVAPATPSPAPVVAVLTPDPPQPVVASPPAPAPVPAITTPAPVQTPPSPAHLLSVCILGICLDVL